MPAAAVIPAPVAYIKVVAVEKLVVGSSRAAGGGAGWGRCAFGCADSIPPARVRVCLRAPRTGPTAWIKRRDAALVPRPGPPL